MTGSHTPLPNLADSLRRWIGMAGWAGGLSALMSLLTLLGFSLLYRGLPVEDEGMPALLISLTDLSLVAAFGLGTVIMRVYVAAGTGVFDWVRDLAFAASYALPISTVGSVVSSVLYGFPATTGLLVLGVATLWTMLTFASAVLNSQGHYA